MKNIEVLASGFSQKNNKLFMVIILKKQQDEFVAALLIVKGLSESSAPHAFLSESTYGPAHTQLLFGRPLVFAVLKVEGPLRHEAPCTAGSRFLRKRCLPSSPRHRGTHVHIHVTDQLGRLGHRSINWRLMTFSGTSRVRVIGFTETPSGSGFTSNSMRILARAR